MNFFSKFSLWLVGHRYVPSLRLKASDYAGVTLLAPAILLATCIGAFNCGMAGWQFAKALPDSSRLAVAIAAALLGAFVVLAIDRSTLYYSDTSTESRRMTLAAVMVMRIALILCVSAFTSQAVMPVVLAPELKAQALVMRQEREQARELALSQRLGVAEGRQDLVQARAEKDRAQQQHDTLPPEVVRLEDAASRCWTQWARVKAQAAGVASEAEQRERVAAKRTACQQQQARADRERTTYRESADRTLAQALAAMSAAQAREAQNRTRLAAQLEEDGRIDAQALDERSATVLAALLARDSGAFFKWLILSGLLLGLELLPFVLKIAAGQSSVGLAVAYRRREVRTDLAREHAKRLDDDELAANLRALSLAAAQQLAASPEAMARLSHAYASHLAGRAPLDTLNEFLHQFEEQADRVAESIHRHPHYADRISQVWADAVERATKAMQAAPAAT